jgi:hypothetical protein
MSEGFVLKQFDNNGFKFYVSSSKPIMTGVKATIANIG